MRSFKLCTHTRGAHTAESIFRWRSNTVEDLIKLIHIAVTDEVKNSQSFGGKGIDTTYSRPLKMGFPPSNSARMQPTDHTSMAVVWQGFITYFLRRIDLTYIVCETQHNFWSAVPSSRDVFRHEALASRCPGGSAPRSVPSRQPKVADLEPRVGID